MKRILGFLVAAVFMMNFTGCATLDKANRYDSVRLENSTLKSRIKDLEKENARIQKEVDGLLAQKEKQIDIIAQDATHKISELEQAKLDLERALKDELAQYKTKMEMTERGLVLTFLAEIFFDSGKDVIREEAKPTLQKVAGVLNDKIAQSYVAVEGYTDNVPIKHSGWRSNWELSSGRALAVVHYFIDDQSVDPRRLSGVGYGEFRPVATNDTDQGRQQNRRVEIVILPTHLEKKR